MCVDRGTQRRRGNGTSVHSNENSSMQGLDEVSQGYIHRPNHFLYSEFWVCTPCFQNKKDATRAQRIERRAKDGLRVWPIHFLASAKSYVRRDNILLNRAFRQEATKIRRRREPLASLCIDGTVATMMHSAENSPQSHDLRRSHSSFPFPCLGLGRSSGLYL